MCLGSCHYGAGMHDVNGDVLHITLKGMSLLHACPHKKLLHHITGWNSCSYSAVLTRLHLI